MTVFRVHSLTNLSAHQYHELHVPEGDDVEQAALSYLQGLDVSDQVREGFFLSVYPIGRHEDQPSDTGAGQDQAVGAGSVEAVAPLDAPGGEQPVVTDDVVPESPAPVVRSEAVPEPVGDLGTSIGRSAEPVPETPLDESSIQPQAWADGDRDDDTPSGTALTGPETPASPASASPVSEPVTSYPTTSGSSFDAPAADGSSTSGASRSYESSSSDAPAAYESSSSDAPRAYESSTYPPRTAQQTATQTDQPEQTEQPEDEPAPSSHRSLSEVAQEGPLGFSSSDGSDLTDQYLGGSAEDHDTVSADEDRADSRRVQDLQGHGRSGLSPASDDPNRSYADAQAIADRDVDNESNQRVL